MPIWNSEVGVNTAEWMSQTLALFEDPDHRVSGWVFWPWKRVPENSQRYRHLMAIRTSPEWDAVRRAIALPADAENQLRQEAAVAGMNNFVRDMQAKNLVTDEAMVDILTSFQD